MKKIDDMVARFKNLLLFASDLSEPTHAFFDLTEMAEFRKLGKQRRSKVLDAYLPVAYKALFSKSGIIIQNYCFYVKKYKIYHGNALLGHYLTTMIYAEDLDRGLLAICDPATKDTKFLRISQVEKGNADGPIYVANPREPATD